LEDKVRTYLSLGAGMSEVLNYPWADEKVMLELGLEPSKNCIEISNPPAPELRYLQTTLLPNLIKNIRDNIRFNERFKIFELARVYHNKFERWDETAKDNLPQQPKNLVGVVVGNKKDEVFLEIKGIVEDGIKYLVSNIKYEFKPADSPLKFLDKSKILDIYLGKEKIGWLGEVNYSKMNFKGKQVAVFEIDWNKLLGFIQLSGTEPTLNIRKYKKLSSYPVIERDIAVEIDWDIKWGEVANFVNKADKLISQVEFLSEYPLENKKSLAFRVVYQAERTLRDKEVEKIERKILDKLKKKFGAELRK
jgi:phenylalanyl-tRNA synthetase beta chain